MSALRLQWRRPDTALTLAWRGPDDSIRAALDNDPMAQIAVIIGPPGGGAAGSVEWGGITGVLADQTDLQTALDNKQDAGNYANQTHAHIIADVVGLQTALNNKQDAGSYANLTHTHVIADVTGLQSALNNKQPLATVLTNTTASFTAALETKLNGIAAGATANVGTVTSVSGGGTVSGLTLTGSITDSGSLTLEGPLQVTPSDFASQAANTFLAAPSGAAGGPTFRAIVAADIPTLNQSTTGSAATLTTGRTIGMTGDVTWTSGSFNGSGNVTGQATIANNAVTLAKMATVATGRLLGRVSAATGNVEALTGAQVTTLLDVFTPVLKGLVPPSGGGTSNFLRADGSWAAPPGGGAAGGSPGGTNGEIQFNNNGAFAGAANAEIENGNIKLVSTTDPAPPAGGIINYSKLIAGRHLPKIIGPSGIDTVMQVGLHGPSIFMFGPASGVNPPVPIGGSLNTSATMSFQQTIASVNRWQAVAKKRFQSAVTAGSTTGCRTNYTQWFRGSAAGFGGFWFRAQFGQNIHLPGSQCFVGLCAATGILASTAGAVSALVNSIGMGYDTTDASGNWFLIRNDATGVATKVDLGAGAVRNTNDGYDLVIHCPSGAATEIFVLVTNIHTGAVVLETSFTTDIPAVNTGLAFKAECSNGAVAAATNIEVAKVYIESDY